MDDVQELTPKKARPPRWQPAFLNCLRETGNVRLSCASVGISRTVVYNRRNEDKEFAAAWSEAMDESADILEQEARRRAHNGVDEPVIHQGELMGEWVGADGKKCDPRAEGGTFIPLTVKKYSDTLLIFLLKGARPDKFRDNHVHEHRHSGSVGASLTVRYEYEQLRRLPYDELLRRHREALGLPGPDRN